MDASACGVLPGPMTLLWRTAKVFPNDTYVTLYSYDSSTNKLTRIQKNLQAKDGYVSFEVTEGKVFVLSDDPDLESAGTVAMADVDTIADDTSAEGTVSSDSNQSKQDIGMPLLIGLLVIAAAAVVILLIYRARHQKTVETNDDAISSCDTTKSRINKTEDNKAADDSADGADSSVNNGNTPTTMKGDK
jgi:hypothetical protein